MMRQFINDMLPALNFIPFMKSNKEVDPRQGPFNGSNQYTIKQEMHFHDNNGEKSETIRNQWRQETFDAMKQLSTNSEVK